MTSKVRFWVAGVPVPQGSKTAFVVGKRAVVTDANRAALKPWRSTVSAAASESDIRFDAPVRVLVEFRMPRPKSVTREWPSVKPDVDKLARALLDGLTDAALIRDDAQVVVLVVSKVYADRPGADVEVELMDERNN